MPSRDLERYRRQLEKQLRADVELLYTAYTAKFRAYEMLHQLQGDLGDAGDPGPGLLPAAAPPLSLPPAELSLSAPPAEISLRLPPAAPAPPNPAPLPRSKAHELYFAVSAALEKLPELFDRQELEAVLGYTPRRAGLYRVLQDLRLEGHLAIEEIGEGSRLSVYRKLGVAPSGSTD